MHIYSEGDDIIIAFKFADGTTIRHIFSENATVKVSWCIYIKAIMLNIFQ